MSLVLVVLYESNWLQEDGAKLFFFAAVFLAILVLARYSSRKSESSYSPPPNVSSFQPLKPYEPVSQVVEDEDGELPEDAQEGGLLPARTVSLGVRLIRFKSFDAETGPPDPESFCDDVNVEISFKRGVMPWDFTVATPKWLAENIRGTEWDSQYFRQMLVVPHYDYERITAELLHRITTELERVPEEVAEDEMKDAESAG